MPLLLQGFLLGLAKGPSCLAACAPVFLPYLVSEGRTVRRNTAILCCFLSGRPAGLVVALPVMTRRRTRCALFCPMGAVQSFSNHMNPVEIAINRSRCRECDRCVRQCPTLSLDARKQSRARMSCTKRGKCVDECPTGAISYHVKGTRGHSKSARARILFLYPAFTFLTVFGGGMVQDGLYLEERLDIDGDGANELDVRVDTAAGKAEVLTPEPLIAADSERILRVRLKDPRR